MTLSQPSRVILWYLMFGSMLAFGILVNLSPQFLSVVWSTPGIQVQLRDFEANDVPLEVHKVSTRNEWYSIANSGKYVLFVDGDWNLLVVMFRDSFKEFAGWCASDSDYVPVSIELHTTEGDPMWQVVNDLCHTNSIPMGGMKFQGAGVVVWLEDGEIRDFAHCAAPGGEFLRDGFGSLKSRTERLARQRRR